MRLSVNNMPRHMVGNVTVYLNGERLERAILVDDHWGLVKRYKTVDGKFIWDAKRRDLLQEYVVGEVLIVNHWEIESRKIL